MIITHRALEGPVPYLLGLEMSEQVSELIKQHFLGALVKR